MIARMFFGVWILFYVNEIQAQGNWKSCEENESIPTRSDTSTRVEDLRRKMAENNLDAYIIPTADFHLSEFVSGYDKRREYISGFTGSMGTAVITKSGAALWTVGKYFLQAETELACDWTLLRDREPGVPTIEEWLGKQLAQGNKVGLCPYFFGIDNFLDIRDKLAAFKIRVVPQFDDDLIDSIWTQGRPERPSTMLHAVENKYSGRTWQEKITDVRQKMTDKNVDAVIITGLDETAWLFNLRGADITGLVPDPFFYSVAIVTQASIRLFVTNPEVKLTTPLTEGYAGTLAQYLSTSNNGKCSNGGPMCVQVEEYSMDSILTQVSQLKNEVDRIMVSYFCNYAVYFLLPGDRVVIDNTPVALLKVRKNPTEVIGMMNCNLRDAAALAMFAAKLEYGILNGEKWTELSAAEELHQFRSHQDLNRGLSFESISATGSNAAIIHYFPSNTTDTQISTGETYLIDSGGQYLDGTTDITRTFFFGLEPPSAYIKECYTRVLMGQINLAQAVWPQGLYGRDIDILARVYLYDVGLQYNHGTGHGVGAYLSVHEGPARISNYHPRFKWDIPLESYMFFSDEPGYYEAGQFGIRLENIVYVKPVHKRKPSAFKDKDMLGLETITLFPYEPHLIDYDLLSDLQIEWLNDYNKKTRKRLGGILMEQGDMEAYRWVMKRTEPITRSKEQTNAARRSRFATIAILCCFILKLVL